jgi:hypothetical protein
MRKYLLIFAMLAIVLTACRIETNVNLDIEEDGSAVVLVEVGMDDEFREAMTGQTGATEEDFINEILSIGDTSLVQRSEGDMSYFGAAQEIDDLSQGLPVEAANEMFTAFDYSFDENGASLRASIQSADTGDFGDFEGLGGLGEGLIGDIFSANVIVRMPGSVTSHNADEVRDGALVWEIPLSGSLDIQAESSFGDSSTNWIWFALGAVVIVGAVSATIAVIVTRKESEKAVAAAIAAHEEDNRQQTTDNRPEADAESEDGSDAAAADDGPPEAEAAANYGDSAKVNDDVEDSSANEVTDDAPKVGAEAAESSADEEEPAEEASDSSDSSDTDET